MELTKADKRIPLITPTMHGEEMPYIQEAFDRNWIAPLGFNCDGFEQEIEAYLKNDVCALATISGTAALHLAVKLAGVRPGDFVLCSDMTFAATVNALFYEGGVPIFIDSEAESWNMDPAALERGFTAYPSAKVVILTHLYGTPARVEEILAVCRKHNAVLIEDAAEALGAMYHGIPCGTFGQYNALSFNGNKIITTSGGGMLLTKDREKREKALFWATQSREKASWYQHEELGYNYRMSNILAGIGRGQMKYLEEHRERKERIYRRYETQLKGYPVKMNPFLAESRPNFWLSCLTVDRAAMCEQIRTDCSTVWQHENGETCPDEIAAKLSELNIDTKPIWKPMHMQPYYREYGFLPTGVGEDIFARGICLPSDIKMTKEEQELVIAGIKRCFD